MSRYVVHNGDQIEDYGNGRGFNHTTGRTCYYNSIHKIWVDELTKKEKRKERERKEREWEEMRQECSRPDEYEKFMNKLGENISETIQESNKEIAEGAKKAVVFGGLFLFINELVKDPKDPLSAVSRTAHRLKGIVGWLLTGFVNLILGVFILAIFPDSNVGNILNGTQSVICTLVSIGFLRMIFLRPFFPTIKRGKEIKLPVYVYVIIEILSLVLITKPVAQMLDYALFPFYIEHKDIFEPMLEIWALGIIAAGVVIAAISGIILCLLIRKMVRCFSRIINSV